MRGIPNDRVDCLACGASLPSRYDRATLRGRPRIYCDARCREHGRSVRTLESRVAYWRERGRDDIAERVLNRIEVARRLWRSQRA